MEKSDNKVEAKPEILRVTDILDAAWNTHGAQENDPAFDGLKASMRQNGQIQRITVRTVALEPDDAGYELIDGHRRLAAAKAIGWEWLAADVLNGVTDEEAQTMTATANIQRLDNDPILEAELIERLTAGGKTYASIAAIVGKDEKYIARRARLINLTERWRKFLKECDVATAADMEMVASYERKLQDEVYDENKLGEYGEDDEIYFEEIENDFERSLKTIGDDTPFDTADCMECTYNTACHKFLFAEMDEKARCQDAACYTRKWSAAVDAVIEALRAKKVAVKEVAAKWNIPHYWDATPHKERKNTHPYVYEEDGLKHLFWAQAEAPKAAGPALTEEEKAEAKRIKKAHNVWRRNRLAAYEKIRKAFEDVERRKQMLKSEIGTPRFNEWVLNYLQERLGETGYILDDNCQNLFKMIGSTMLNGKYGCELTDAEVTSCVSMDPADTTTNY